MNYDLKLIWQQFAKEELKKERERYEEIVQGTWDYKWREDGCQHFIECDDNIFTFCAAPTTRGRHFCKRCSALQNATRSLELSEFEGHTPQTWFEKKKNNCKARARVKLGFVEDV